jgi:phage terminase large subunit-like protein
MSYTCRCDRTIQSGFYTGIRNSAGGVGNSWGCCERREQKFFHTPLQGVLFASEHPWKIRKDVKHRRNRTRGMLAQILNPRGQPALLEMN